MLMRALVNFGHAVKQGLHHARLNLACAPLHGLKWGVTTAGQKRGPFKDGGVYDRTGLKAWRQRRAQQGAGVPPALVHLIARSSSFSGADDVESTGGSPACGDEGDQTLSGISMVTHGA